jgi:hypothetical protein
MSYATYTSILTLFPGLPQSSGSQGYNNITNRISQHITRAEALINGAIGSRYNMSATPFTSTSTPPLVTMISQDITGYYTYRSEFSGDGQNDSKWLDRFKEAIDTLYAVRDGKLDLCDTSGALVSPRENADSDEISSNTEDYAPVFGEDSATAWVVDANKLSNYADSR